jgi:hypothetical protein
MLSADRIDARPVVAGCKHSAEAPEEPCLNVAVLQEIHGRRQVRFPARVSVSAGDESTPVSVVSPILRLIKRVIRRKSVSGLVGCWW